MPELTWLHLPIKKPSRMEMSILNITDQEKKKRDNIFANPQTRLNFLMQAKTPAFFEMNSVKRGDIRETGIMMAADVLHRLDQYLDQMIEEINLELI
jgi:hypothetical protein